MATGINEVYRKNNFRTISQKHRKAFFKSKLVYALMKIIDIFM